MEQIAKVQEDVDGFSMNPHEKIDIIHVHVSGNHVFEFNNE